MHVLMFQGNPVTGTVAALGNLLAQAERAASRQRAVTDKSLEWNSNFTRLFRVSHDGRRRFTGYEVREVPKV